LDVFFLTTTGGVIARFVHEQLTTETHSTVGKEGQKGLLGRVEEKGSALPTLNFSPPMPETLIVLHWKVILLFFRKRDRIEKRPGEKEGRDQNLGKKSYQE